MRSDPRDPRATLLSPERTTPEWQMATLGSQVCQLQTSNQQACRTCRPAPSLETLHWCPAGTVADIEDAWRRVIAAPSTTESSGRSMWVRERAELWPFWDYVWEAAPLPVLCRITVLMDVSDVGAGKGGIMADLGPSLGRKAPIPAFSKGSSARKVARNSAKFFPKLIENFDFFSKNGAKMGSGPHLGRRWVRGGKKSAFGTGANPFRRSFLRLLGTFFDFFF